MSTVLASELASNELAVLAGQYWEKGYIVLHGLFEAEEASALGAECDRLLQQDWVTPNNLRTPYRMNSSQTPERIDPVTDVSPLFGQLVDDERILRVLRAIWNDETRPYKDKLIFRMPGVDGYTMHQDWAWWHDLCPADEILSVSIQIDGADLSNGCIELFPNYHHELLTPMGMKTNFRAEEVARVDASLGEKIETRPGDVLIFHSLTPHQSGKNTADYSRRSLYLTYNSARAGDLKATYYQNYLKADSGEKFFK